MNDSRYFIIDNRPYKVLGIKADRVIFQLMLPRKHEYARNRSFKINFNGDDGYYVIVPQGSHKQQILMSDILKKWDIYNNIKEYSKLLKEN